MATYILIVSKYIFIALMLFYTIESYMALINHNKYRALGIFQRQNAVIFTMYIFGMVIIYLNQTNMDPTGIIILGGAQLCYLIVVLGVFPIIYPKMNRAILSNMCMLLSIGFLVILRLANESSDSFFYNGFKKNVDQFIIVAVVTVGSLMVPFLLTRFKFWKKATWGYAIVGFLLLAIVLVKGPLTGGANLSISLGGFAFQPSEFVKILFVFFIAALLNKSTDFKTVIISAVCAGVFVLTLVASTDLGSALIFFTVYLFMLYVGTRKGIYLVIGGAGFSVASVLAYFVFSHVRTRVAAWLDPWPIAENKGYQITQSLFALGSGKFTGTGLLRGRPQDVPVVHKDFVFSAIGEEFGMFFGILLILVCLSCFLAFLLTAMGQVNLFYKLVCVGLGVAYAIQVILTVGGAMNMLPSTGVTLPLVSYGGSSILSSLIVFAIIQGMAIVSNNNRQVYGKRAKADKYEE